MTFKKLMELYRSGKASDIEKQLVEDEVEKFEVISDYVYDEEDKLAGIGTPAGDLSDVESIEFAKSVRKQVRMVVIRIALVLIILFALGQVLLPPAVDKFFYDPAKEIVLYEGKDDNGESQKVVMEALDLDFEIFSQLRLPLESRTDAYAKPLGYGRYDIAIYQNEASTNDTQMPAVGGEIVRNDLRLYSPDFLHSADFAYRFSYFDNQITDEIADTDVIETNKDFLDSIKNLDSDDSVKAIISFKNEITYREMLDIEKKYELDSPWYAIKSSDSKYANAALGFTDTNQSYFEEYAESSYPELFCEIGDDEKNDEQYMKDRFVTMLNYMSEQNRFLSTFDTNYELDNYLYKDAAAYIEKNGLSIYGIVTYVNESQAQKLVDDKVAYKIGHKEQRR